MVMLLHALSRLIVEGIFRLVHVIKYYKPISHTLVRPSAARR